MAATGKTPILLYGSTTPTNAPVAGNLTNSSDGCEIAINVADKNLFFKDSTNVVNTVPIRQSSASSNGWLSSTDWSTFNNKQPAGSYALTTGTLAQFASTTSAQLAGVISDETGSGSLVFATSPTLSGPSITGQLSVATSTSLITGGINLNAQGSGYLRGLNVDGASSTVANVQLMSWFGIGFSPSITGQAVAQGENAAWIDCRSGAFSARSDITTTGGNFVVGTSGKGIDFSATPGTGTSELLADYEEGTWTPTQGGGLTVVGAFTSSGTYTKVGRQVTVIGRVNGATSVAATSGGVICAGLPFNVSGDSTGSFNNLNLNQGGSVYTQTASVYAIGAITATGSIYFTATYFV
jgi:hypothetical protein